MLSSLVQAQTQSPKNPNTSLYKQLNVAVASNFLPIARIIAEDYQRAKGIKVLLSSGASGKLSTQIRQGAPFDVFLSADRARPEWLIEQGLAEADSLVIYAIGQLALISRLASTSPDQLPDLARPIQVAMANPRTAPYGTAAQAWLDSNPAWPLDRIQFIQGENINQTWHFFTQGGVDMALVALAQIKSQEDLPYSYWLLPQNAEVLTQAGVVLKNSSRPDLGQDFLAYLLTAPVQAKIQSAGYALPPRVMP